MKNNKQSSETNTPITDYFLQNGKDSYILSSNTPPAPESANQSQRRLAAYAKYIAKAEKTFHRP